MLDLSGNGGISVTGPGATSLIQTAMAHDVEYLFPERCLTTLVLSSDGAIVDLATVYRQVDGFLLESSVGRASALLAQLESLEMEDEVTIAPLLDAVFLGIEGPTAWEWIGKTIGVEATGLPFQGVTTATVAGAPALVARSGVTGEFGYKVCLALDAAKALWSQLAVEVTPTGYDALEIAMLEVRQPNVHAEVVEGADAITCGFNWVAEPTKASFVGRDALLEQFESNTIRTIGFEVEEPSLPKTCRRARPSSSAPSRSARCSSPTAYLVPVDCSASHGSPPAARRLRAAYRGRGIRRGKDDLVPVHDPDQLVGVDRLTGGNRARSIRDRR